MVGEERGCIDLRGHCWGELVDGGMDEDSDFGKEHN